MKFSAAVTPDLRSPSCEILARYFDETWRMYDWLFSAVDDAALHEQPDPLRHPLIFYVGHTAAFYTNKLRLAGLWDRGQHEVLDPLFARGVDPHAATDLERFSWPDLSTTLNYREQTYTRIRRFIEELEPAGPITETDPLWALLMGIEHDRIHFETSSVLIRQLPLSAVSRPEGWTYAEVGGEPSPVTWLDVPARRVRLGRPEGLSTYGWDNEHGCLEVDVAPFRATQSLITNRDFHRFWAAGGYQKQELWSAEGWQWRQAHDVRRPRFWVGPDSAPRYRAMFDVLPMPWSWPVEVCAHEAEAFCRWRGARLLTEAEHAAIAQDAPCDSCGDSAGHPGYNLNLRRGSPSPVGALPAGQTPLGFHDVCGNVWQWLADDFRPLPGFAAHPYYADFSAPYFDSQHATLTGGSWASTGESASRYYRLWFRRHFYQHAGFRMAQDA